MTAVTREQYLAFGHSALPPARFDEFAHRAGLYARERTFGRFGWPPGDGASDDPELLERNLRGVCALADLFFRSEAAVGIGGAAITSFANEGYRETYESDARAGSGDLHERRLKTALAAFFSPAQLSRRAG